MRDYFNDEVDPFLDPLIKSYYELNLNLARTIAFKSDRSAVEQNKALINQYGDSAVNESDPTTWKYYLNISGEYHPTDTPMVITSLDTLKQIVFNKVNLNKNPNTKAEYQFGTSYYKTLVTQYPFQEDIIMGILMPADINEAIASEEGTILRYSPAYVEPNEYSLIKNLEDDIKFHMSRWYVDAYSLTDRYNLMAYYSILSQRIITKLFNLRDSKRNTYEANSFHIKIFLRGYFGLDQYYKFLTPNQAFFLYRNLPRLVRYTGYDSQFQELVDNILTPRNIKLFGYTIRQTNVISSDYTPVTIVKSEILNKAQGTTFAETLDLKQLADKESAVLYGTQDFYDSKFSDVKFDVQHQNQAKVITKDIAVQAQDNVSVFSYNLDHFLMSHWAYMAAINAYTANITFQNPRTGDNVTLSAKDAFVYFYYLSLSYISEGLSADLIKSLSDSDLQKITNLSKILLKRPLKTIPYFLSQFHVTNFPNVTAGYLVQLAEQSYRARIYPSALQMAAAFVPLTATNTPELFYKLCVNIYLSYNQQNAIAASFTNYIANGYLKNMVLELYQDTLLELYPANTLFSDFLTKNNLDSYDLASGKIDEFITNIYQAGTGSLQNTSSSQQDITKAMLNIMKSLTSYNIQYIEVINEVQLTHIELQPSCVDGQINSDGITPNYVGNDSNINIGVDVQAVEISIVEDNNT